MASGDDSGVKETCLDEVEVDDHGNVVPSSIDDQLDILHIAMMDQSEEETDADAVAVDEDGNLRIQSASRLLSEMDPDPDDTDSRTEERRRNFRQHLEHGTVEEESEMLAMDALQGEEMNGRHPRGSEQDGHSIELTFVDSAAPEAAEESHLPPGSIHSLEMGDTNTGNERRKRKGVGRVVDMAGSHLSNVSLERAAILIAVAVIFIGVCLTASLLPASFVYVEYYELALAKNKLTGTVNREDVYYPGCHLLTPQMELVRFKGTAHLVHKTMKIVTSDRLMFDLDISVQYFIKPEELGQLFTNYAQDYSRVVEAKIQSSIHTAGSVFTLEQIRLNRTHVERILKEAVALTLTGNCCPTCCPFDCGKSVDCRACVLEGRGCTKGIHMELRYFQMGAVDIPEDVSERFLQQTLLLIEAEKEVFVQQHALVTKMSEQLQKEILNRASEVREAAMAEAQTIRLVAEAEYDKQVQTAYAAAWKKLYQRLNITQEDHKLSLMYIRALDDISDHLYNLNYDKLTTYN